MFSLSVKFLDIVVAAILFEMYPAGIMLFTAWLFRREVWYRRISVTTVFLISLSMVSLVFANVSQVARFSVVGAAFLWRSLIGVVLVVGAIVAVSLSVFGLRWGTDLSGELSRGPEVRSLERLGQGL